MAWLGLQVIRRLPDDSYEYTDGWNKLHNNPLLTSKANSISSFNNTIVSTIIANKLFQSDGADWYYDCL